MTNRRIAGWVLIIAAFATSALAQTTVTTTGGTTNTVPMYSGSSTVVNSNITQLSSGYIGIGTTSPVSLLDVYKSGQVATFGESAFASQYIDIRSDSGGGYFGLDTSLNGGSGGYIVMAGLSKTLNFAAGSDTWPTTPQMTLSTAGFLGIGTTAPAYLLDVSGVARATGTIISNQIGGGTGSAFLASSTGPGIGWYVTGQATDQKAWDALGQGTALVFRTVNDANTNANTWMQVNRGSGYTVSGVAFPSGNVGIGTTVPSYNLDVAGTIRAQSGIYFSGSSTPQTTPWTGVLCGGDYAEAVNAAGSRKTYEPGDVLVIGDGDDGEVQKSAEPYSTMVAGIFATKPGVIGRRQTLPKGADEIPMAMIGIVPTKVTAENGSIRRGDLLVTSSTAGFAMKGTDRNRLVGAVIGKAMGSLDSGTGVIEVLVTLQ